MLTPEGYGATSTAVSALAIGMCAWYSLRDADKADQHPVAWLIFAAVQVEAFAAQYARGGRDSIWILCPQVAGCLVIAAAAWRHSGTSGWRPDALSAAMLGIAVAALGGWWFAGPAAAIVLATTAEGAGSVLTGHRAYRHPGSQVPVSWLLLFLAGLLDLGAVTPGIPVLYVYPAGWIAAGLAIPACSLLGARSARNRKKSYALADERPEDQYDPCP